MGVTNTSAHLQVLRGARLVETRKDGTKVFYRLAGDEVAASWWPCGTWPGPGWPRSTRWCATTSPPATPWSRSAGPSWWTAPGGARWSSWTCARPRSSPPGTFPAPCRFRSTISTPPGRLPKRAQIVAYCRGPYCVLAPQAVERLRARGYDARRLADGMPEWRLAGLPVAAGAE